MLNYNSFRISVPIYIKLLYCSLFQPVRVPWSGRNWGPLGKEENLPEQIMAVVQCVDCQPAAHPVPGWHHRAPQGHYVSPLSCCLSVVTEQIKSVHIISGSVAPRSMTAPGCQSQRLAGRCRPGDSVETCRSSSSREINTNTMCFLTPDRQYAPRTFCSLCLFDEWNDGRFSSRLQTKALCTDCALRSLSSYWFGTGDCHIRGPLTYPLQQAPLRHITLYSPVTFGRVF